MYMLKNFIFLSVLATFNVCYVYCEEIEDWCFGCICKQVTNCNVAIGCVVDTCGAFRMTEPYWIDSGNTTVNNIEDFTACANDPYCAALAVRNYMVLYGQDCNDDDKINCDDYVRMHVHGRFNCKQPSTGLEAYTKCKNLYV